MRLRRRASLALILVITAFGFVAGCTTAPAGSVDHGFADGRALVAAMHARYEGAWFRACTIEQRVTHYRDGAPAGEETWREILTLPGRVRSTIGAPDDGNLEVYVDGASHVFRDGALVHSGAHPHAVLLLGFDVYVQDPGTTIAMLEAADFDLDLIRDGTWNDRRVWIVGAEDGNLQSNQCWIDAERLLVARVFTRSPRGRMVEVQFDDYRPLGGGWIAASLVFKVDGATLLEEEYVDFTEVDEVDPDLFALPGR